MKAEPPRSLVVSVLHYKQISPARNLRNTSNISTKQTPSAGVRHTGDGVAAKAGENVEDIVRNQLENWKTSCTMKESNNSNYKVKDLMLRRLSPMYSS